ncbi:nucleotidyl transferase AbiEii/AbiGii toxin family protein [Corynebacterium cystitidis]|uniref:Nucleotidyl transferase AbiEii toxin, Type IV TA system n=1 Tax=Corynebacterium cystitidis DSM 20524 TaxID=1121357 RepID=A0A1H9TC75_9CORY|nr:nucleotidyl transferase AbiEii/AbiGii toxin family protein [Corynebacterium cystitidis]WJY83544.1 hypothetical protein CCYS_13300 [Corynebacterium cystitidis DSM 20524]SER94554.1 Nucleotidyl transferase AbiEii toxin, Type IV TA system [Corynebacterium cystitidis DSM 20524]SNV92188.1 Nucleotidyl transferase of uncharacterised function (DUF1814) [Corynebacterium cystitidis]
MALTEEEFQQRVAELALHASAADNFLLAGGKALQAHGLSGRPTQDIDLFTNQHDLEKFELATDAVVSSLRHEGYNVVENLRNPGFARLEAVDEGTGMKVEIDLGIDWRSDSDGVLLPIGGVLSKDDVVASKTLALFGRAYARDLIDFDSILRSGLYDLPGLFVLAQEHDPGFDPRYFADALKAASRHGYREVMRYGLSLEQWQTITDRMVKIADDIMREL